MLEFMRVSPFDARFIRQTHDLQLMTKSELIGGNCALIYPLCDLKFHKAIDGFGDGNGNPVF